VPRRVHWTHLAAVTTRRARGVHALPRLVRSGLVEGRRLGLARWASAPEATVAMGCSVAHVNSTPVHFSLGLFK
jgi:hypothetical protein